MSSRNAGMVNKVATAPVAGLELPKWKEAEGVQGAFHVDVAGSTIKQIQTALLVREEDREWGVGMDGEVIATDALNGKVYRLYHWEELDIETELSRHVRKLQMREGENRLELRELAADLREPFKSRVIGVVIAPKTTCCCVSRREKVRTYWIEPRVLAWIAANEVRCASYGAFSRNSALELKPDDVLGRTVLRQTFKFYARFMVDPSFS